MKVICDLRSEFLLFQLLNCLNWKFTAKITYHLHIYPQFIYESFHIHYIISLLSRENMNSQLTSLPMCGFIAQFVEHRTGIAEVTGSNPVEALIFFFRLLYSNCLNWKFTAKITYHLNKYFLNLKKAPFHKTSLQTEATKWSNQFDILEEQSNFFFKSVYNS